MTTPVPRVKAEQALQNAIDAIDSLFETREIRPGEVIHEALVGGHPAGVARIFLPMLSGTHLGRLIRNHGREFIHDYR